MPEQAQIILLPKTSVNIKQNGVPSYSLVIMEIIGTAIKIRAKAFNSHMSLEKYDSM